MRPLWSLMLAALLWLAAGASSAGEEKVLNVYNWADYVAPDTIGDFEREYGIHVNYDVYDSTELAEAKLLSGHTGYDVVIHSYRYAARLIPIGVFQPLDRSRLHKWNSFDSRVLEQARAYDPGNRYGIPYMWGTTGITYNVDMIRERMPDAPLDSGALLFDPAVVSHFADCGVSLLDEPSDVIPMVLLYLGRDPNSMEPEDLAAAEKQLKSIRPYIRYFASARMLIDLPNRDICMAMTWSGDYAQAMARAAEVGADVRLAYTMPKEGSMLWFDGVFIPADAEHPGNAHLFLDYLMRPEVMAGVTNATHYANPSVAARAFVRPEILADPAIYPPQTLRNRFGVGFLFGPKAERRRTRVWSRVKTGL